MGRQRFQHLQSTVGFLKLMKPNYIRNSGKQWSLQEVKQLKSLVQHNTPTRVIGLKLGRPEDGVRGKASQLGISLKPTNQSPYNRNKPN
jgi:hypothetical protein